MHHSEGPTRGREKTLSDDRGASGSAWRGWTNVGRDQVEEARGRHDDRRGSGGRGSHDVGSERQLNNATTEAPGTFQGPGRPGRRRMQTFRSV